jgi:hypothetical protein
VFAMWVLSCRRGRDVGLPSFFLGSLNGGRNFGLVMFVRGSE